MTLGKKKKYRIFVHSYYLIYIMYVFIAFLYCVHIRGVLIHLLRCLSPSPPSSSPSSPSSAFCWVDFLILSFLQRCLHFPRLSAARKTTSNCVNVLAFFPQTMWFGNAPFFNFPFHRPSHQGTGPNRASNAFTFTVRTISSNSSASSNNVIKRASTSTYIWKIIPGGLECQPKLDKIYKKFRGNRRNLQAKSTESTGNLHEFKGNLRSLHEFTGNLGIGKNPQISHQTRSKKGCSKLCQNRLP